MAHEKAKKKAKTNSSDCRRLTLLLQQQQKQQQQERKEDKTAGSQKHFGTYTRMQRSFSLHMRANSVSVRCGRARLSARNGTRTRECVRGAAFV